MRIKLGTLAWNHDFGRICSQRERDHPGEARSQGRCRPCLQRTDTPGPPFTTGGKITEGSIDNVDSAARANWTLPAGPD